jgi:HEAT repeat protein
MSGWLISCLLIGAYGGFGAGTGSTPKTPPVADLIAILKNPDKSIESKRGAVKALKAHGVKAEPAIPLVAEFLVHKNLALRLDAVQTLEAIGPAAIAMLAKALKDTELRPMAAGALSRIGNGNKEATAALLMEMTSTNPRNLANVVHSVNKMRVDPKEYVPSAIAVINAIADARGGPGRSGEQNQAGELAMEGLAKIGPAAKEAVPALIRVLKIDEKTITNRGSLWMATIRTLGEIGSAAEPALPLLRSFLNSDYYGKAAERAIEKIKGEAK